MAVHARVRINTRGDDGHGGADMLTRTNVIFQHSRTMMLVVAVIGAFHSNLCGHYRINANDIKKVLAYSRVSQLGFMSWHVACGGL